MNKSKHAVSNPSVAHGGGMTNLRNHLDLNDHAEPLLLYTSSETDGINSDTSKMDTTQSKIEYFICIPKLPVSKNFNRSSS